ncbi:MAG: hypothetical protein ACKOAR_00760 [Bacteroidota bacterium]
MNRSIIFTLLLLLSACASRMEKTPPIVPLDTIRKAPVMRQEPPKPVVIKDSLLDRQARYLAGLSQQDSSAFAALEGEQHWQVYKALMDDSWEKMRKRRLEPMEAWRASVMEPKVSDSLTLFYPFSGPDFLHAQIFYPQAPEVVMAALEPVIAVPDVAAMTEEDRDMMLDTLGNSMRDLFGKSYFITLHMMKDFRQIRGVLPVFYFLIARTGNELISQRFFVVDAAGNLRDVPVDSLKGRTGGVQLSFRSSAEAPVRTLTYFSVNIADNGLIANPGFLGYVKKRSPYNAFVKSASYLMHIEKFSGIRNELLRGSASLFQDDTGIPYRFVKPLPLNGYFYGEYMKPVKDFSWLEKQPDLDSAFQASREPLPFSLGYHWNTRKQHYMLFIRNQVNR